MSLPVHVGQKLEVADDGENSAGGQAAIGVLAWWVMAMVLFPESQRRAQEEIDRVIGRKRLPTPEDLDNLPYMQAMVCSRDSGHA